LPLPEARKSNCQPFHASYNFSLSVENCTSRAAGSFFNGIFLPTLANQYITRSTSSMTAFLSLQPTLNNDQLDILFKIKAAFFRWSWC